MKNIDFLRLLAASSYSRRDSDMPLRETENGRSLQLVRACASPRSDELPVQDPELRNFARYARILTATLRWTDRSNKITCSQGLTRDIGAGGAFIQLSRCPTVGTAVRYEVFLPAVHRKGTFMRIAGSGEIVRIERLSGMGRWHGVAVRFLRRIIRVHRMAKDG
jgi:hypothetical protein